MAYSIRFPRRHDKADRNGRYAVRLCITKNKRRKYIALELYADPAYWDEAGEQFIILRNLKGAEQKAENKQREADNALLVKYKARAREIVERFEIEGIDWTLNQFEDAFLNTSKQESSTPISPTVLRNCTQRDISGTPRLTSRRRTC